MPNSISVVRSGLMLAFPLVEEATRPFMPPILEEDMVVYFAFDWGILPVCPYAPRSFRLSNKDFVDRAPKNIVDQEKTNYSNLKNDIKKISLTIKNL